MEKFEEEIFALLVKDKTAADIATELCLTTRCVENYLFKMARKYKCRSKVGLALYAFKRINSISHVSQDLCGEKIGEGLYRDVFVYKPDPALVVKIERDMSKASFANAMEWRNYIDNKEWKFLAPWLAPCERINETGQVLIQRRVSWEGKRRKDYPKQIPDLFTDLKVDNFGWIGDQFVCCDYPFLVFGKSKMKTARWWGSLKK